MFLYIFRSIVCELMLFGGRGSGGLKTTSHHSSGIGQMLQNKKVLLLPALKRNHLQRHLLSFRHLSRLQTLCESLATPALNSFKAFFYRRGVEARSGTDDDCHECFIKTERLEGKQSFEFWSWTRFSHGFGKFNKWTLKQVTLKKKYIFFWSR